jgi:diguanylate cyclase (GGDEF)-like protein
MRTQWHPEQSLNDWHRMFYSIYGNRNSERDRFKIYAHLCEVAGGFSKVVRKGSNPADVTLFLGKLFAWHSALATKINHRDLESIVWDKYPAICPYCGNSRCKCAPDTPHSVLYHATLRRFREENRFSRPDRLSSWQKMFQDIYGIPNRIVGLTAYETDTRSQLLIALNRLSEEMGEVAEAIRLEHVSPIAVSSELADVFAWMMAVANILPTHLRDPTFSLEQALWSQYPGRCNYCYKSKCICWNDRVRPSLIASVGMEGPAPVDELTGLPRRDVFESELADAVANVGEDQPLGLMFLDLDNFKLVNDKWGHPFGDVVLRTAAEVMDRIAEAHSGRAYRWGGEEFAVLIRSRNVDQAQQCADRLRTELQETQIIAPEGSIHSQTVSIGLVSLLKAPQQTVAELARALVETADRAMYQAKKDGRNRIVRMDLPF